MLNRMKVAVIGPFYNGVSHVRGWLRGFVHQTYPHFKLYLVDDASTDDTVELINHYATKWRLPVCLIQNEGNRGPAASRNSAIRRALEEGADLIVLLDSDCRVRATWLSDHVRFHQANPSFPVLGGGIIGRADSAVGIADGYCSWFTAVPNSRSAVMKRLHLCTTNMSIRSQVFRSVGFFDESLATGEDVAFCRSVRRAGHPLYFESTLTVEHLDRNDWKPALKHHYRWGLHSTTLSRQSQGGYYAALDKLGQSWLVFLMIPVIALLNTLFVLARFFPSHPRVAFYLPWIWRLKWENAKGVYRGFVDPTLCRLHAEKQPAALESAPR